MSRRDRPPSAVTLRLTLGPCGTVHAHAVPRAGLSHFASLSFLLTGVPKGGSVGYKYLVLCMVFLPNRGTLRAEGITVTAPTWSLTRLLLPSGAARFPVPPAHLQGGVRSRLARHRPARPARAAYGLFLVMTGCVDRSTCLLSRGAPSHLPLHAQSWMRQTTSQPVPPPRGPVTADAWAPQNFFACLKTDVFQEMFPRPLGEEVPSSLTGGDSPCLCHPVAGLASLLWPSASSRVWYVQVRLSHEEKQARWGDSVGTSLGPGTDRGRGEAAGACRTLAGTGAWGGGRCGALPGGPGHDARLVLATGVRQTSPVCPGELAVGLWAPCTPCTPCTRFCL